MKLYICEKPNQGRAFADALNIKGGSKNGYIEGDGIIVTWCIGHLLKPYDPVDYGEEYKKWSLDVLPILPRDKWSYKANPSTKAQLKVVKELISKADEVVICSDPDREGELIVVSLLEKYKFTGKRTRVWTSALNSVTLKKAISESFDAKKKYNGYLSAMTRQKADWIHGMNLTRAMTVANKGKVEKVLSIGRVQTAILNIIVMRDLEIENFISKDYFEMSSTFKIGSKDNNQDIKANWVMPKTFIEEGEDKCLDRTKIEEVVNRITGKNAKITKKDVTRKIESAPLLYSLSELQKECDKKLGMTPAQTLEIAQSLYETHKATSYPRTDCQYLNLEQFNEIDQVFNAMIKSDNGIESLLLNADKKKKTKVWNTKKVEASAHHAIIPTIEKFNISALSDIEYKVYDLIRRRYIAQFYPEAESDSTNIEIICDNELFKTTGSIPILSGWKDILDKKSETKDLPNVNKGDELYDARPFLEIKKTKPPARYNASSILDVMLNPSKFVENKDSKNILKETDGIGTEATRAGILDLLTKREYTKNDKRNVISTTKGRMLIKYAPEQSKSVEMTAYWESQLLKIESGELDQAEFLSKQEEILTEILDEIKSGKCTFETSIDSLYNCPNCDSGLRKIKSKKNGKTYWVCTAGDQCKSIFQDSRGKPLYPKKVDQGSVEHICEVCKKDKLTRKISKKDTFYWQCEGSECKQFYSDDNMTPKIYKKEVVEQSDIKYKCFSCKKNDLERKKGQYGFYWNCSSCKTNFKDDNLKPIEPAPKPKSDYKCDKCKTGYLTIRKGAKGDFWGCNSFPKCKNTVKDDNGKPENFKK